MLKLDIPEDKKYIPFLLVPELMANQLYDERSPDWHDSIAKHLNVLLVAAGDRSLTVRDPHILNTIDPQGNLAIMRSVVVSVADLSRYLTDTNSPFSIGFATDVSLDRKSPHFLHRFIVEALSKTADKSDMKQVMAQLQGIVQKEIDKGNKHFLSVFTGGFKYLDDHDNTPDFTVKKLRAYIKGDNVGRKRKAKRPSESA